MSKVLTSLKQNKRLALALKATVSVGLMYLVFSLIPMERLGHALASTAIDLVLLSLFVALVANYADSIQMHAVTSHQGIGLTSLQILKVNLIVKFYSLFLPGTLAGGVIRWYHFSRGVGEATPALAAIIFNRLLEISMLVLLGLVFWALDYRHSSGEISFVWITGFAAGTLLLYMLSFSPPFHRQLRKLSNLAFVPAGVTKKVDGVLAALATYAGRESLFHIRVMGLALLRHLVATFGIYLLAESLSLGLNVATIGWFRSVFTLALMLPISIGGFGVREVAFIVLLRPVGVETVDAVALSLLLFGRGLVIAILGGVLEFERVVMNPAAKNEPES